MIDDNGLLKKIVLGQMILSVIFLVMALFMDFFSIKLLYSVAVGDLYTILNFVSIAHSAKKALKSSPKFASVETVKSYMIRYVVAGIIIALAFIFDDIFSPLGVILPMFFSKFTVIYLTLFTPKKNR